MSKIIEIMARADVDYFWQDPGKRFDHFEKTVADGVRARMAGIVAALASAGFEIKRSANQPSPGSANTQAVREIAADAFTDAVEILGIIEVLEAGNKRTTEAINKRGAGRAAGHIQRSLLPFPCCWVDGVWRSVRSDHQIDADVIGWRRQ